MPHKIIGYLPALLAYSKIELADALFNLDLFEDAGAKIRNAYEFLRIPPKGFDSGQGQRMAEWNEMAVQYNGRVEAFRERGIQLPLIDNVERIR